MHELIANLQRAEGSPVDANPLLALGVSNVICGITMSVRFANGDARFERLNNLIEEGMRLFGEVHYGEYVPLYNVSIKLIIYEKTMFRKNYQVFMIPLYVVLF